MLYDFELAGRRTRLWQRTGESYGHVLMKALGYAMFVRAYPNLEIEVKVGLRYKPDLIAQNGSRDFDFWGECGTNAIRKTNWILKHTRTKKLALFKIDQVSIDQLIRQLREEIAAKYRTANRLSVINFVPEIYDLTAERKIEKVLPAWFRETVI